MDNLFLNQITHSFYMEMFVKQFNFECEMKFYFVQQMFYRILTIVHNPQCECMGVGYTMARLSKFCQKIMMIFSSDSNMVNNANKNHLLV